MATSIAADAKRSTTVAVCSLPADTVAGEAAATPDGGVADVTTGLRDDPVVSCESEWTGGAGRGGVKMSVPSSAYASPLGLTRV